MPIDGEMLSAAQKYGLDQIYNKKTEKLKNSSLATHSKKYLHMKMSLHYFFSLTFWTQTGHVAQVELEENKMFSMITRAMRPLVFGK